MKEQFVVIECGIKKQLAGEQMKKMADKFAKTENRIKNVLQRKIFAENDEEKLEILKGIADNIVLR